MTLVHIKNDDGKVVRFLLDDNGNLDMADVARALGLQLPGIQLNDTVMPSGKTPCNWRTSFPPDAGDVNSPLKATGNAAAVTRSDLNVVKSFTEKLAQFQIKPDVNTVSRVVIHFHNQMLTVAQPEVDPMLAYDLYKQALLLPSSATRSKIANQLDILLNGPWLPAHPNLIRGVDKTGKPLVLKLLYVHEQPLKEASVAELHAVAVLQLDKHAHPLVPAEIVEIDIDTQDTKTMGAGGTRKALKMPWYVGSLLVLPRLSEPIIYMGTLRIQEALEFMHSKDLIHMDVKPLNILVDFNGLWYLTDFGATLNKGEEVTMFTQGFHPDVCRGCLASEALDWGLLVITVAVLLEKDSLSELKHEDGKMMDRRKCVARCERVGHSGLRDLLKELVAKAG